MTVLEIVFAVLLILSCVFIVAVVLMQESKQGMSNVISGGSSDNYFQKNSGRTKEAKLSRATKIAAVIVFIVAIAVNLITVYWGGDSNTPSVSGDDLVIDTASGEELPEVDLDTADADIADDTAEAEPVPEETASETTAQ